MAGAAQTRGPGLIGLDHGVVEANGKQNRLAGFALLFERCLDFFLHPGARDGVLRQDHHQLVVETNRLVDAGAELVADLQVLGGKPAADLGLLQVGMQAPSLLSEGF